jgi:hypothetical protein
MNNDAGGGAVDERQLGDLGKRAFAVSLTIGLLGIAASLAIALAAGEGFARFLQSYLVNFSFFLSLSLGALFFVLIQHLTGATWGVVIRRLGEAIAANLPMLAVLAIPIVVGISSLYSWADAEHVAGDHLLQVKQPYLNPTFFTIRLVIYFLAWTWLSRYYYKRSVEQDTSGDVNLTHRMQRLAGPAMVIFALTFTFASFDLLMSLDPHWFSTIYGVYFFAGSVVAFHALIALTVYWLQKSGRLEKSVTREHFHDVGKMVFAFTIFWAYIAFSQYMLIWYSNIPEETIWYLRRQTGQWTWVTVTLLFGHFFLPFFGLISRYPKRQMLLLLPGSLWVLAMHWVDIYWLAMPEFSAERIPVHALDFTLLIGLGGLFAANTIERLRKTSLIPEKDPRLEESLAFENA